MIPLERIVVVVVATAMGCGYTMSAQTPDGADYRIAVSPIREPGLDVDAAADVGRAVRIAVARTSGLRLVDEGNATHILEVEVLGVTSGLAPFSEPALRAAQYVVRVSLQAVLRDGSGVVIANPSVFGESRYLSTPGGIETLDGANRRAIERAAVEAADRLMLNVRAALARR